MRKKLHKQLPLSGEVPDNPFAKELEGISRILDDNTTIYDMVEQDLACGKRRDTGRKGMTAEQVARCALLKNFFESDYRALAFHLEDSTTARWFSRLAYKTKVKFQTLQRNIKRITSRTWEKINELLVQYARNEGIEKGKKVRTDCTVVKTNIHHPTDASLLNDCVRVFSRLLSQARKAFSHCSFPFRDHHRAAKRRLLEVVHAKNEKKRRKAYRKLLRLCEESVGDARGAVPVLRGLAQSNLLDNLTAESMADELEEYISWAGIVIDQTWRRVINGEKVPVQDKIVSIFEPHTDIIVKGRRETQYGHKICLTTGASCLITDCVVEDGNPADSTLVRESLKRHKAVYGYYPDEVAYDGGFSSKSNLEFAKSKEGIENVLFTKRRGIDILDMVQSMWIYRKLKRFRAGVEGCISALKRICGLDVCNWKGLEGFKRYVHCGVVSYNLLIMARRLIG